MCGLIDAYLLTEESPDDRKRLTKDFFWCIDPLDGTLPFIESTPGYSVAIALVSRTGIPYLGVVFDPVKQTLYHALKGQGIFRNDSRWSLHTPEPSSSQALTFITDRSFTEHSQYSSVLTELEAIANQCNYDGLKIIQQGGAAMNACWVLEQEPACYFKFPKPEAGGGGAVGFCCDSMSI